MGGGAADDYGRSRSHQRSADRGMILEVPAVVFNRKPAKTVEDRSEAQSALVEMLMDADELERRRLLLIALQTGELKKSEAEELLRLVDRL